LRAGLAAECQQYRQRDARLQEIANDAA